MTEEIDLISFEDDISVASSAPPSRSPSVENIFRTESAASGDDDTFSITSQSSGTKTPVSIKAEDTVRVLEQAFSSVSVNERDNIQVAASRSRVSYYAPRKPAVTIAAKKAPAIREGKEKVRLLTNLYTLQVRNKIVYRYDINVTLMRPAGHNNLNLAKGQRDDNAKTERNQICMEALRKALETFRMMREGSAFVYDGASIMFSSDSLEMALKPHGHSLTISVDQLPPEIRKKLARFPEVTDVCIELQACKDWASEFDIADFQQAHSERDMAHLDRTWKQFFEMLTNQNAVSSGKYFCFGAGKLFPTSGRREEARGGQERVLGANKGIKFIQAAPESKSIVPALVLDAKIGQFFKSQNLVQTICEFMRWPRDRYQRFPLDRDPNMPSRMNKDWKAVNDYIKGMRLIFTGSVSGEQSFVASGISSFAMDGAEEEDFRGQMIRTADRFPQLNAREHHFHWPMVLVRGRGPNGNFIEKRYPMDLLMVAPYQRVPKNKQVEDPPRAGPPQTRFRDINSLMQQLDLDQGGSRNHFLQAFGVSLSPQPIEVDAIRRERPKPVYNSSRGQQRAVNTHVETASWRMDNGDQYAGAGEVEVLFVAHTCNKGIAEQMAETIARMAQQRGMRLGKPFYYGYDERADPKANMEHLFPNIKEYQKSGKLPKSLLVLYVDRLQNKSHGLLKLFERQFLVLTQHITTEVAQKLIRQPNTCSNIVNKLNCKLHGINHSIRPDGFAQNRWITDNKSLIIGYDVAHPPPQLRSEILDKRPPTSPSVVGFSFNGGPHSEAFIGDFHYQTPKKEEVNDQVLIARMKWMLSLFVKNRGSLPENIFIYRDGVSEGQYAMAIDRELEAIKQGVEEYCNMNGLPSYRPAYVMLVVTKRHNTRFVRNTSRGIENSLPGTSIDTGIVRADCTEFYLQGHRVLQGTGKTPSYVVLVDDLNLTMDQLQSFTLALCFSHQIFEGGISLPEPVYQADEWAKRGNDLWRAYEDRYELEHCKSNGEYCTPPVDFEAMTNKLAYWNTDLQTTRINA